MSMEHHMARDCFFCREVEGQEYININIIIFIYTQLDESCCAGMDSFFMRWKTIKTRSSIMMMMRASSFEEPVGHEDSRRIQAGRRTRRIFLADNQPLPRR